MHLISIKERKPCHSATSLPAPRAHIRIFAHVYFLTCELEQSRHDRYGLAHHNIITLVMHVRVDGISDTATCTALILDTHTHISHVQEKF
jgi:hypothetical protein